MMPDTDVLLRRARRINLIVRGRCFDCTRPREPGNQCCEFHMKQRRDCDNRRKDKYVKTGRCRSCGKPIDELSQMIGYQWCVHCQSRYYSK